MVLLLITSCNKVDNKMESQIPDDAVIVAKIDIPTLISNLKIEVKDGKMVLPEKFAKMLEAKGEDFSEDAAKLINSGIDFEHSIYLFAPDTKELSLVTLVPVSDPAKLKQFLTDEEKASFESKDGLEVANMGEMAYVIKEDLLYVTSGFKGQDPATIVNGLLTNKKNMGDNASIVHALDAGDDINVYVNTKRVKELAGNDVGNKLPNGDMAKMLFDLMDIKCSAFHMNLADGEWNISVENEVDDNGDFMKLVNSITTKPSADLLAFMPKATNMGVLNLNLDGEGILNLDMVKAALGEMGSDPQMAQILDIVKSVKGPVTLGVAASQLNPEELSGALAFKCGKSKELIDLLKQMLEGSYTQNGDEYVFNQRIEGYNASLSVKGDVICVKVANRDYTENMASVGEAKDVIGNAMCGAFLSLGVDNMQMQLVHNGKSVKEGKLTMWVKEDGKKLSPLDALTFFDRLSRQVKGL